jgi:hypothetical protein
VDCGRHNDICLLTREYNIDYGGGCPGVCRGPLCHGFITSQLIPRLKYKLPVLEYFRVPDNRSGLPWAIHTIQHNQATTNPVFSLDVLSPPHICSLTGCPDGKSKTHLFPLTGSAATNITHRWTHPTGQEACTFPLEKKKPCGEPPKPERHPDDDKNDVGHMIGQ